MRYYVFSLASNSEQLQKKAKIKLRDYDYESPVAAMNLYMYRNLKTGIQFFAYREEEKAIRCVFAYNEKVCSVKDAYELIVCLLNDAFGFERVFTEPVEITIQEFYNCGMEAKRRGLASRFSQMTDQWLLDVFYYYSEKGSIGFMLDEYMIPLKKPEKHKIFDRGFKQELENIENHAADLNGIRGNAVHYFISARSGKAAREMVEALAYSLMKAGRVGGRRIDVIHDIEPDIYQKANYLEHILANNSGGIAVIDLSVRFGRNASQYAMAGEYIETLFRQYRNQCLFIFTYDMNEPGFSYLVLPKIRKFAVTISLREGSGDRKAGVRYLTSLIKNSDLSQYSGQANEFMKQIRGDRFSQTEIIEAFEKFEAWCINRNVLGAYDVDMSEDYMLERDENGASAYEELQRLIGLKTVKRQLDELLAANAVWRERKRRSGKVHDSGTMHMVFGGNPGTAKTTVARLFAGVGKEKGLLKSGVFVERGGMDLNGFPETVRGAFTEARGGVLFIDEAYTLCSPIAIATLLQEMEAHRDDVIVILAGYNDAMKAFLRRNEGLSSRIPNWIDFPDYSVEELTEIFRYTVGLLGFSATEEAVAEARYIFEKARTTEDFGNGRFVRSLVERSVRRQSMRLFESKKDVTKIRKEALFLLTKEDVLGSEDVGTAAEREPGSARRELEAMIGLESTKKIIRKAVAHYKMNKLCMDKGINRGKASMHMVFTGNPGTAKTTVARLFAQILRDDKVLPTGKFIEVGRADLVGAFVGSTAIIVKSKFREAKGGVLFIDEAYSLCDYNKNSFGDEAINTIVQEMENNREDTVVIFAGYPAPMEEFLARNPGLESRLAFRVGFEDYSADELLRITELMASRKGIKLTAAAMEKLGSIYENARKDPGFGNGRFVRKLLEEAEMNLAERLFELGERELTEELISTVEEQDIPDIGPQKAEEERSAERRIGFR